MTDNRLKPCKETSQKSFKRDFRIEEKTEMPCKDGPIISSDMVICVNLSGTINFEYDLHQGMFQPHDISVLLPNHPFFPLSKSDDYHALLLFISYEFFIELRANVLVQSFLKYKKSPSFNLTDDQFECIVGAIRLLDKCEKTVGQVNRTLLIKQVEVIMNLIDIFSLSSSAKPFNPVEYANERVFEKFYVSLTENFTKNREIKFYAKSCGLTPKYFSSVIKKETGIDAAKWISNFVILKAKTLLAYRDNLSIQQVSNELGFVDQTSFSRYFRHHTGVTPSDYRKERQRGSN